MDPTYAQYSINNDNEMPRIKAHYRFSQSFVLLLPPLIMMIPVGIPLFLGVREEIKCSVIIALLLLGYLILAFLFHWIVFFANGPQNSVRIDKENQSIRLIRKSPFLNIAMLPRTVQFSDITAFTIQEVNIYGYRSHRPYGVVNLFVEKRSKRKKIIWRSRLNAQELKTFLAENTSKIVNHHDNRIWDDFWVKNYGRNYE